MSQIINMSGTPFEATQKAVGGYTALGTHGNKFVIFSGLSSTVVRLSPSEMTEMNLKAVCGAVWCDEHFSFFHPKKEEFFFDHRAFATAIIRDCQAKGPFNGSHERKAGVWKTKAGQLVVNSRELWYPDGVVLDHGIHDDRIYSVSGDVGFDRTTPEAGDDVVQRVLGAFGVLKWRHPLGAELLLGFLGLATVTAALRRRPHVLVTGPAGVGKSTVLELMTWLLGPVAYPVTGPQTLPAYCQALNGTARTVILDEFEADPSRPKSKETLETARMSYSLQEGDEGIVRGTGTGTARSYHVQSMFLAGGINPGKMEPADITRWVQLEAMSRISGGTQLLEAEAREAGPKLARLFVNRWDVFQATEVVVRERILLSGGDGRIADTVGTLLASYWTFVSSKPATADDADVLVEMLDIGARIEVHAETDERRCLEALMSKLSTFKFMMGEVMVTRSLSIAEAVQRVCEDPTGNPEIVARLAQLGLRVVNAKGKWLVYIVNSPEHQELRKLFGGTKWSTGGWSTVLRRLPGGGESTQRVGVGFGAAKVTVFDVPADLLPANGDCEELMAA